MSNSSADRAKELASRALISLAYGYGAICAPAIVLTPLFFHYWMGPDFALNAVPVAEILFFGVWINGLALVPFGLLQGQGRPDITGKFHAAEVLPFMAVLWLLTAKLQIVGAAIAWTLRAVVDAALLFWAARTPMQDIRKAFTLPLLFLIVAAVLARTVGEDFWKAIIAAILVGAGALSVAALVVEEFRSFILSKTWRAKQALAQLRGSP
jgi:O-antigen/teichoic acid export membrane protein